MLLDIAAERFTPKASAEELGITDCFAGLLSKPALIVVDQAVSDWRYCKHGTLHVAPAAPDDSGRRHSKINKDYEALGISACSPA
jgi:hypothetical protein